MKHAPSPRLVAARAAAGLAAACLALALPACGGGSSVGGGIGGTGKPTLTYGAIATVDSLSVAGTSFSTQGTTVALGGEPATPADLRVGMTALVTGSLSGSTHAALHVEVEDAVKGPLTAKPDAGTLIVLGQTVQVGSQTTYGPGIVPASPDGLAVGDLLEVYGFVSGPGVIVATRVEREDSLSEVRVRGIVAGHDALAERFAIGALTVDYTVADLDDLPGGLLADGLFVRVRGPAALGPQGELMATEVKGDFLEDHDDNDETEIEGVVTALLTADSFQLNGVTVQTSAATRYEGGTAAEVVVGTWLEVEGALVAGVLHAREVEFEDPVRIEADVESVGADFFTLVGLPGLVVTVDARTEFEDVGGLAGLAGGHVRVQARKVGPATVLASEVELESPSTRIELQGPVDESPAPADPLLYILGVAIDTSAVAADEFEGEDDQVIGRAAFFAALAPGVLVKAQGDLVAGAPAWDEMELEGEDD